MTDHTPIEPEHNRRAEDHFVVRHGGGLIRYLMTIVISVVVTLVIVQDVIVDRERDGCNRRQPIFRAINKAFDQAASTLPTAPSGIDSIEEYRTLPIKQRPPELAAGVELRLVLEEAHEEITPRIVGNCDGAYPKILRFIG